MRVLYTVECAVHSIRTAPSRICKVCDIIMIGSKMSHALVAEIASITWDLSFERGGGEGVVGKGGILEKRTTKFEELNFILAKFPQILLRLKSLVS